MLYLSPWSLLQVSHHLLPCQAATTHSPCLSHTKTMYHEWVQRLQPKLRCPQGGPRPRNCSEPDETRTSGLWTRKPHKSCLRPSGGHQWKSCPISCSSDPASKQIIFHLKNDSSFLQLFHIIGSSSIGLTCSVLLQSWRSDSWLAGRLAQSLRDVAGPRIPDSEGIRWDTCRSFPFPFSSNSSWITELSRKDSFFWWQPEFWSLTTEPNSTT